MMQITVAYKIVLIFFSQNVVKNNVRLIGSAARWCFWAVGANKLTGGYYVGQSRYVVHLQISAFLVRICSNMISCQKIETLRDNL